MTEEDAKKLKARGGLSHREDLERLRRKAERGDPTTTRRESMRLVQIESPFKGKEDCSRDWGDFDRVLDMCNDKGEVYDSNTDEMKPCTRECEYVFRLYALACLKDSLDRGEAPFASHLLYPQVIDDAEPEQRELGMRAGWEWGNRAALFAIYQDLGISDGMRRGIARARDLGIKIEYRELGGRWKRT